MGKRKKCTHYHQKEPQDQQLVFTFPNEPLTDKDAQAFLIALEHALEIQGDDNQQGKT
jgi:hypothetical protein